MHAFTSHTRPEISFEEMRLFMFHGWGELGARVADCWREFNARYFDNKLQPLPIVLVSTSPHGHWLGLTHCGQIGRTAHRIELTWPRDARHLVANRGVLLHEMVHQHLAEQGLNPAHAGEPWCAEIQRLHLAITGARVWAAPDIIAKERLANGSRVSVRKKPPAPDPELTALGQAEIARWPSSVGLDLGDL